MPLNLRGKLTKKARQADLSLMRAQRYIAEIRATIEQDHQGLGNPLNDVLQTIDHSRHNLAVYVRGNFYRSNYKRYTTHKLARLIRNTKPIPKDT